MHISNTQGQAGDVSAKRHAIGVGVGAGNVGGTPDKAQSGPDARKAVGIGKERVAVIGGELVLAAIGEDGCFSHAVQCERNDHKK